MALDQATRDLQLTTPLGDNELLLVSFTGHEQMSQLFRFQLELISDNNAIQPADIVGKEVGFSVRMVDGSRRHFHGVVNRFSLGDEDENQRRNYRAEVVPWLWFLTRTSDCRIFQNKTVPQIVEQIFQDLGFSQFSLKLTGNHPQREYVVQYRETDFNFISRLLEEEGVYYFFKHEQGGHELVISDDKGASYDVAEKEVSYLRDVGAKPLAAHITNWEHQFEFRTGKVALTDYTFKNPSANMRVQSSTTVGLPGVDKFEFYDYPGIYDDSGNGRPLADIRMEEEEAGYDVVVGASNCSSFSPGGKFQIKRHRSPGEEGKQYLLVSVLHEAAEVQGYEVGRDVGEAHYGNTFTCIPAAVPYRPPRVTRKPHVQGVQTAVVVGPAGEEIYTDPFGRVKVQFPWDREGKKDENSSCWIRVSQNWAGQNWGAVFHPRIGQEVIVDFVEGDPDRPIITGRVYNAEQMPPYPLPGEQTKSTIKTRSSKGGGSDNFNEIRFEDKLGSEEMYIHAEKDQNTVVEHDQTITVGNDRVEKIGRDRSLDVGRDKSETVGRHKVISVAANHTESIGSAMSITVGATLTEFVGLNYAETVGGAMELTVGAALAITVGAAMAETVAGVKSETVGASKSETIGGNKSVVIAGKLSETVRKDCTIKIVKDRTVTVGGKCREEVTDQYMLTAKKMQFVADDEISIKTGSAEILMKKNGDITIKGKKINVKGTGNVTVKGSKILEN